MLLYVCDGDVVNVVFSVCIVRCGAVGMLYVCVLCTSYGSPECCVLHDLQFVNAS